MKQAKARRGAKRKADEDAEASGKADQERGHAASPGAAPECAAARVRALAAHLYGLRLLSLAPVGQSAWVPIVQELLAAQAAPNLALCPSRALLVVCLQRLPPGLAAAEEASGSGKHAAAPAGAGRQVPGALIVLQCFEGGRLLLVAWLPRSGEAAGHSQCGGGTAPPGQFVRLLLRDGAGEDGSSCVGDVGGNGGGDGGGGSSGGGAAPSHSQLLWASCGASHAGQGGGPEAGKLWAEGWPPPRACAVLAAARATLGRWCALRIWRRWWGCCR